MRKKMIAALCVQLAAVLIIFCFSPVTKAITERYGTDYSLRAGLDYCWSGKLYGGGDYYSLELSTGYLNSDPVGVPGRRYHDVAPEGYYVNLYRLDEDHVNFTASVKLNDNALGEKLYRAFNDNFMDNSTDGGFDPGVFNNYYNVEAHIRIFGNRVMLRSVTVNGRDIEDFFREEETIIA